MATPLPARIGVILQDPFLRVHTFIKLKNYFSKLPEYETSILLEDFSLHNPV